MGICFIGRETRKSPALMFVGASNHLPEDEALQALFDRFFLRVKCDNITPDLLSQVLNASWKLEQESEKELPSISAEEVKILQSEITQVNLEGIQKSYLEIIRKLRNAGVQVSDRRAVKLQRLIAASALICGRKEAVISDMWVLRFIWDTEEQREIIAAIDNFVENDQAEQQHPRATKNNLPDAEEILKEGNNSPKDGISLT